MKRSEVRDAARKAKMVEYVKAHPGCNKSDVAKSILNYKELLRPYYTPSLEGYKLLKELIEAKTIHEIKPSSPGLPCALFVKD